MQKRHFSYSALNFPAENVDIFSKALKRNVAKLFTRALGINSSKQNNINNINIKRGKVCLKGQFTTF